MISLGLQLEPALFEPAVRVCGGSLQWEFAVGRAVGVRMAELRRMTQAPFSH